MIEYFKILFSNFSWCDIIIVILAFLNIIPVAFVYISSKKIKAQRIRDRIDDLDDSIDLKRLKKDRNILSFSYNAFVGITSIFPLLGLLGTVVGIIQTDVITSQTNFMIALTSTFWGLVASVIYKFIDSFIGSNVDNNIKTVDIYINEITQENAKQAVIEKQKKKEFAVSSVSNDSHEKDFY